MDPGIMTTSIRFYLKLQQSKVCANETVKKTNVHNCGCLFTTKGVSEEHQGSRTDAWKTIQLLENVTMTEIFCRTIPYCKPSIIVVEFNFQVSGNNTNIKVKGRVDHGFSVKSFISLRS